ncbi:hypothetical protein K493DRAFT_320371, partial [Basidiobolus meristosporus CBS 931.73]
FNPVPITATLNKEQQEKEKQEDPDLNSDKVDSNKDTPSEVSPEAAPAKCEESNEYEYNQLGSDEESKPKDEKTTREGPKALQDAEELYSEHDLQTPVSSDAEDFFEDSVEESQPLLTSEEKDNDARLETAKNERESSDDEIKDEKAQDDCTKEKVASEGEEKQCRICYGGLEEEPSFGKLISPCKCKGTMKYVHLECLNSWRLASGGGKSFFECDSCHYKYNFQRTAMAKVATNPFVLTLFSLLVFVFIIFLAGFPVKIALQHSDMEEFEVWDEFDDNLITIMDLGPFLALTNIDLFHMLLGLVLVGIIGFLHFLVSTLAFGGPIPIIGFGYRNGGFRGNRGDDRFGGGILLVLVAIGIVKAFWTVYKIVRSVSRRSLEAVGAAILEVHE